MAKKTGTSLTVWEAEFENIAKENAKNAKVSEGKFLSFKSGQLTFGGANIEDNELRCVIVGWAHHNAYYDPDIPFNPKNPQSPICYATNASEEEMVPHENSPEPQNNGEGCATCPFNQFESARQGKGKACKNGIRLALIAENDLENVKGADVVYASIPPKSIKNWLVYVTKELRDRAKRPHWAVTTLLKVVPDDEAQFKILFTNEGNIEDSDLFPDLKTLWTETMEGIDFPYTQREAVVEKKSAGGKGKPAKFARK